MSDDALADRRDRCGMITWTEQPNGDMRGVAPDGRVVDLIHQDGAWRAVIEGDDDTNIGGRSLWVVQMLTGIVMDTPSTEGGAA